MMGVSGAYTFTKNMPWKNEISSVGLTGVEFFIRKDALDIVDYVYQRGFKMLISSSGLLLVDEIIKKLASYSEFFMSWHPRIRLSPLSSYSSSL